MKYFSLLVLLSCIALASASSDWKRTDDPVLDNYAFSFKIGLKPQNLDTMDSLFWEVSNPKSPFYGHFLNNQQIANLISLPQEDIQKVMDYLQADSGMACAVHAKSSLHREYILVDTCAAQAQIIFPNLNLAIFERANGHKILRSTIEMDIAHNMSLLGFPFELHQFVDTIQDVTDMPIIPKRNLSPTREPYAPSAKLLNIPDMIKYFEIDFTLLKKSTIDADDGQVRIGVIELDNLAFSQKQLAEFQKKYDIPLNPVRKIIGEQSFLDDEPSADVQFLTSLGQNMQVWDFVFADSSFRFTPVVDEIMSTPGAPKVYSLSYGEPEVIVGESQVKSSNVAFMKFGLAGYTFVASAGDVGPVLNPNDCQVFNAEYPASSPYITSVGGTSLNKTTGFEQAWIHGSGGFSTMNKRPAYQDKHVEAYLKQNQGLPANTNSAKYNVNNRAYPDVSAFAAHSLINDNGFEDVEGTSLSSPEFVALLGMVNAYRYQNGLGPMGAINQALYNIEGGIGNDVVHGMSYATSRYGCFGEYLAGFKAVPGWDAVTGLGSPKFKILIDNLGHIGKPQDKKTQEKEMEFLPFN